MRSKIVFPKVLIIGETFNLKSGGGVTLSHLFEDWPKEYLLNAGGAWILNNADSDRCSENYQFGELENKYLLPIFIRKRLSIPYLNDNEKSGIVKIHINNNSQSSIITNKSKIKNIVKHVLHNISYFFGLQPLLLRQKVSEEFLVWINATKPDLIYTQLGNIYSIRFVKELIEKTKIPLCIHIMDDWPSSANSFPGLFYYYWKKRTYIEFNDLVKSAKVCMSISQGMSDVYKARYDREFIPFHNPIDLDFWLPFVKQNFSVNEDNIRLLYAGRIGLGVTKSLIFIARAIDELKDAGHQITLFLQSPITQHPILNKYVEKGTVIFNPQVEYSKIPSVFSNTDLLILPYDFDGAGVRFIKYSMPTKASEFMMSGTPILLFCPESVYLSKHAKKNCWAHVVSEKNIAILKKEILFLVKNKNARIEYSKTALAFAIENFESGKVKSKFHNTFMQGICK